MLFRWLHRRSKQLTQEKACIRGDLRNLHGRDEALYSRCMEEVSADVAAIVVPPLPNAPVEMRGTTFLGGGASRLSPEYIQHAENSGTRKTMSDPSYAAVLLTARGPQLGGYLELQGIALQRGAKCRCRMPDARLDVEHDF
jgi:hypothetical protein